MTDRSYKLDEVLGDPDRVRFLYNEALEGRMMASIYCRQLGGKALFGLDHTPMSEEDILRCLYDFIPVFCPKIGAGFIVVKIAAGKNWLGKIKHRFVVYVTWDLPVYRAAAQKSRPKDAVTAGFQFIEKFSKELQFWGGASPPTA